MKFGTLSNAMYYSLVRRADLTRAAPSKIPKPSSATLAGRTVGADGLYRGNGLPERGKHVLSAVNFLRGTGVRMYGAVFYQYI